MKKFIYIAVFLLFSMGGSRPALSMDTELPDGSEVAPQLSAESDRVVVTVNDLPIRTSELEAHIIATQLSRENALEDLIDLHLLRLAATAHNISVPTGTLPLELLVKIEITLAIELGLDVPPQRVIFTVDHAWLKDADDEKERAKGRALLEKLRMQVDKGASIPDAYAQLQLDGSLWHIGDHEEYQAEILPAEVQSLAPGSLSPIVQGDGGLHLFKVYQIKQTPPPRDDIRIPLMAQLRLDATIQYPESPTN